jgi:3-oxoacyl-[acyl-carrier-protein] synthase-3
MGAKIVGIGADVPDRVLANQDLERMVETSDDWITSRTGIKERRILDDGQDCSDLVANAAKKALHAAGLQPSDIDLLIVGTATPDTVFPSTACWAQPKIGLGQVPVLDISAACSGFLYAYELADSLIAAGRARRVLIVGAEALSRVVNWEDRNTCVLFGDGAGAAVVVPGENEREGLLASSWGADGSLASLLWQPAGGTRHPATPQTVEERKHTVHMAGNEVFKHAVKAMQGACVQVLDQAGVTSDQIDLFVPHQANLRIIKATADRAGVSMDKTYLVLHRYGNVSAASIPMALADAVEEGRLKPGQLVLSASFGAGFTWAASLYRW